MGEEFLQAVKMYRILYLSGYMGSGKTLLSMAIAIEFWKRRWVDNVYSNLVLEGDFDQGIPNKIRSACVIYDEAWQELDSRDFRGSTAQRWSAYLRKRNIYLLLPSVHPVDTRMRTLQVQRKLKVGNLFWMYAWVVDDGFSKINGWFILFDPIYFGNAYDHKEEPSYDRGRYLGEVLGEGVERTAKERDLAIDPDYGLKPFTKEQQWERKSKKRRR